MRALIIEDYAILAMTIAEELRDLGFENVSCASNCAEAIKLAASECPDLITADHRLFGESGIDAVREICAARPVPVVYIVALPDEVQREVPDAVILAKPFTSAGLADAVERAMTAFHSESWSPLSRDGPTAKAT